ncbi:MAG: ABC transporter permease [Clostridiales bacterium]|jgi:NitT/TauT family transport system permease protein|nr:ABC transporter permease [Clostridiales bacterium]
MTPLKNNLLKTGEFLLKTGVVTWILLLAVWSLLSPLYPANFLPGPIATLIGGKEILLDGTLLEFAGISLRRVFFGWFLGSLIGAPLGILIGRVKPLRQIAEPFVDFFRFIPAIAFLTLFIMWFGVGERSKIILILYGTSFFVIVNTVSGVLGIDPLRIQAARTLGASESQILLHIVIPESVPYVFTGVRLGLGGAFTSIVAAEMLAAKEGLGYLVFSSRLYFRIDWILVGVVTLGLLGYFSDRALKFFGKHALRRYSINDSKEFGR